MARQGPHQGAQKSTSTGRSLAIATASKLASLSSIGCRRAGPCRSVRRLGVGDALGGQTVRRVAMRAGDMRIDGSVHGLDMGTPALNSRGAE